MEVFSGLAQDQPCTARNEVFFGREETGGWQQRQRTRSPSDALIGRFQDSKETTMRLTSLFAICTFLAGGVLLADELSDWNQMLLTALLPRRYPPGRLRRAGRLFFSPRCSTR